MSAKRILFVSAAALAGLLALAVGAAFVPQIQTRVARRALASVAPPGASLEGVSAGLNRISLRGLRLEMNGAVLTVPTADADLGVLPAVMGKGYLIKNLVAKGWTLDLTRSRAPAAPSRLVPGPAQASPWAVRAVGAVLEAFNVPAGLSLDGVNLEGVVILPNQGGSPAGKATVILNGGGLAAGQEGRFTCDLAATLDDPAAPVAFVGVRATLAATMDLSGTFTKAVIKADATASGRQFPNGIGLSGAASAAQGSGKTTYSIALVRGDDAIASVAADSPDGSHRMAGTWNLDLKDTDLAPFALGHSLPVFSVAGKGSYDLDPRSGDVRAEGSIRASADHLGVVSGSLDALGPVDFSADFDIARAGNSLRVDRLETTLAGGSPVGSVQALQSFEFNPVSGELKVAHPSGDLVGISIKGIPLAWLGPALPGVKLAGTDARGEFVMRAENGRLALRTKAPLVATAVSLSAGGRAIGSGLEVSSFLLADYSPQGWQVQVAPFSVRSEGIRMLSLEARLGRLAGPGQAIKAAGSWSASLPVLLSQPSGARLPRLSGGDASGSFQASLGVTRALSVKLAIKELALASVTPVALPAITSDMGMDFDSDGRITFNVPLRLDFGTRVSNLVYSGTLSAQGGQMRIDAALSAERLTRDDFGVIAALSGAGGFMAAPAPAPVAVPPSEAPPGAVISVPFWSGIPSRLSFVFGQVALGKFDLRNVRGTLVLEPQVLRIESGMAATGESSAMRFDGDLAFAAGAPAPYSLKATVSANNVDSAPLFSALDSSKPPAVEGLFDIEAHVSSSGAGLRDLVDRLQGDCKLASKDGRFRALRTDAIESVKQAPSALIDALDTVSSLFGKKTDKIGDAFVEAAGGLSEIHYDQMNISAERGTDLDIRFTEISLLAPEVRISGAGRIAFAEGVPVEWQPLSVDLDMGVRGKLGAVLGIIGMLNDGRDELGYTQLYQPIHLGGTLSNIDHSQWKEMLIQAPLRKGGGLIDKLLGK
jgi:hypothetical protein